MNRSNWKICQECVFKNDEGCKPMENGNCIYFTYVNGLAFPKDASEEEIKKINH